MTTNMNRAPMRATLSLMTRCALLAMVPAGASIAMELDTGNPDMSVRWDNTIRYNLGVRTENQDPRIANSSTNDESDRKFDRGDIVTNRLDLLSELDAVYKGKHGIRLSGAAWYDNAYRDHSVTTAAGLPSPSYINGTYNSTTQRFYNGPSGELLDAFLFTNFDVGGTPIGVRLGKHVVFWGEGILLGQHAMSYSQAPVDTRKALSSPGIEVKETFMPINQLSFNAQLTNEFSVGGQYFLDWKPNRTPLVGTYLTPNDALGGDRQGGGTLTVLPDKEPANKHGSFGVKLAYNLPQNAKLGVYYRKFDDYAQQGPIIDPAARTFRYGHAEDIKLVGMSLGATVSGVGVGLDLSHRSNAPLGITGTAESNYGPTTAPRGSTWHMVVNATSALPNLPIYETALIIAELAYNRLDSVTANPGNFKGIGAGYGALCNTAAPSRGAYSPKEAGCATKDYWGLAVNFTPQWLQVAPGVDLSAPMSVSYGLHGNSPNFNGGNEGEWSYGVGLTAMYLNKHEFTLRYQDRYQKTGYDAAGLAAKDRSSGSAYSLNDRAFVSFTYKTSF